MRKICFVFVLSIVSVFSISAQPSTESAGSDAFETIKLEPVKAVEPVKDEPVKDEPESPKAAPEPVKMLRKTIAANFSSEAPKPRSLDAVNYKGLPIKKTSLEGLSTGNPAIDDYIEEFSLDYDIDPFLIYAQMNQESRFKSKATSHKGASGYMQLMPDTARRFGVRNIYNPKQNIKAGIKYMRWLLDKFGGDMRLALAGYNAGEGSVMKYGNKIPPYRETQNYVTKIMTHYDSLLNPNVAQNEK